MHGSLLTGPEITCYFVVTSKATDYYIAYLN